MCGTRQLEEAVEQTDSSTDVRDNLPGLRVAGPTCGHRFPAGPGRSEHGEINTEGLRACRNGRPLERTFGFTFGLFNS